MGFQKTRTLTERLAARLTPEDQQLQSMPEASPTKWHRAHTTWFFETFVLAPVVPGFRPFNPLFNHLFNSYYDHVGPRHARGDRGLISRPTAIEVTAYRAAIDAAVEQALTQANPAVVERVTLGINHEQQHQELLLTDIKHALAQSVVRAPYLDTPISSRLASAGGWRAFPEGLRTMHELRAHLSFREKSYPLAYFRTHDAVEVDVIFETAKGFVALEFKSAPQWRSGFNAGFKRINEELKRVTCIGVYAGARKLKSEYGEVLPYPEFLKRLWADELFD